MAPSTSGSPLAPSAPRAVSSLKPEDTLVGRYELVRILGEGGMGVVWQAKQLTTERTVAIKFLKSDDASAKARFLREAKVAAGLSHPNIVQVFDFWETKTAPNDDDIVFMVMELLRGESLQMRLARSRWLSVQATLDVLTPVARALRYAHAKGLLHRDLKPDNIFLAMDESGAASDTDVDVKVVDFGLARALNPTTDATDVTAKGTILGTPLYMAPEMIYGDPVDMRADIWALGVILYECIAGRPPFGGDSLGKIFRSISRGSFQPLTVPVPECPPALATLVTRMLSPDREARPSAEEVVSLLEDRFVESAPEVIIERAPPEEIGERVIATATVVMPGAPTLVMADAPRPDLPPKRKVPILFVVVPSVILIGLALAFRMRSEAVPMPLVQASAPASSPTASTSERAAAANVALEPPLEIAPTPPNKTTGRTEPRRPVAPPRSTVTRPPRPQAPTNDDPLTGGRF